MDWKAFVTSAAPGRTSASWSARCPTRAGPRSTAGRSGCGSWRPASGGDVRVSFGEPQLVFQPDREAAAVQPDRRRWVPGFVFGRGGAAPTSRGRRRADTQDLRHQPGADPRQVVGLRRRGQLRRQPERTAARPAPADADTTGAGSDLVLLVRSAAGFRASVRLQAAADTNLRTVIYGDASEAGIEFGPGNAATDVRLAGPPPTSSGSTRRRPAGRPSSSSPASARAPLAPASGGSTSARSTSISTTSTTRASTPTSRPPARRRRSA
jgi:hypothetical protein